MKKGNIVIACICIAFSIFVFVLAKDFPPGTNGVPGPGVFPMIISAMLFILSIVLIFSSTKISENKDTKVVLVTKDNKRVYMTMLVLVAYIVILPFLGFLITSFLLLLGCITWYKKKWAVSSAVTAVLVSVVVYMIFTRVLQVPLDFGLVAF